jgi:hypothetical protein
MYHCPTCHWDGPEPMLADEPSLRAAPVTSVWGIRAVSNAALGKTHETIHLDVWWCAR